MSTFKPDAGIPVLTEIIEAPVLVAPAPSPATTAASHLGAMPAPAASVDPAADAERWERLEQEVRERVLQQVLGRIDFVLEQRVRDSLADVLQTAIEDLANDIRSGLHQTVKDVVTRAVMQEITAARSSKK